jgi:hypothetical protein
MTSQEVEAHLEMGKQLLATGQLADALNQFHSAIGDYFRLNLFIDYIKFEL